MVVQGKIKLIFPVKYNNVVMYYVCNNEVFDVLQITHLSIGYGGRGWMIKELGNKYKNTTHNDIKIFLDFCESCQRKQKCLKKRIVLNNYKNLYIIKIILYNAYVFHKIPRLYVK